MPHQADGLRAANVGLSVSVCPTQLALFFSLLVYHTNKPAAEPTQQYVGCSFPCKHTDLFFCRSCSVSGLVSRAVTWPVHSTQPRDTPAAKICSGGSVTPRVAGRRQEGSACLQVDLQLINLCIRTARNADITGYASLGQAETMQAAKATDQR